MKKDNHSPKENKNTQNYSKLSILSNKTGGTGSPADTNKIISLNEKIIRDKRKNVIGIEQTHHYVYIDNIEEDLMHVLDGRMHCLDCKGHAQQDIKEILKKHFGDLAEEKNDKVTS